MTMADVRARGRVAERPVTRAEAGFTILEMIIVIAVMSLLAGTLVPLVTATQKAQAMETVTGELTAIGDALDAYYYEHGAFPSTLLDTGFYGRYAAPGVQDDRLRDEWGGMAIYRLVQAQNPDTITVYSVGDNNVDDGPAGEVFKVTVLGADPGRRRTRQRMQIIVSALANYLDAGGTVSGTWATDRPAIGLGPTYENDGFGTPFTLDASTLELRSAGPDRALGSPDDIVL
jgi:general secretion pathway protein G